MVVVLNYRERIFGELVCVCICSYTQVGVDFGEANNKIYGRIGILNMQMAEACNCYILRS